MPNPNERDDAETLIDDTPGGDDAKAAPIDRGDVLTEAYTSKAGTAAPPAAGDPGDTEHADGGAGTPAVPYARFRAVNEGKRQAEEQLAAVTRELQSLRAGGAASQAAGTAPAAAPVAPAFDLDASEEAYAQAMLDGDAKAAAGIRRQINQHLEDNAFARFESSSAERQVTDLTERVVAGALQQHPWLNEPGGAQALDLIDALREQKIAQGMPRHEAVAQAILAVVPLFASAATPSRELPNKPTPADTRNANANARNAADALLQPAALHSGMGDRSQAGKLDINNLTDEEYQALPMAERKKLRGD